MIMFQGTFIPCRVGGFYIQTVGLYERVKEGQKLGVIVNLFGEVVETIKAPFDGIINAERTLPLVHPGDLTVSLGEIVEP
jgi:predicted deacylase